MEHEQHHEDPRPSPVPPPSSSAHPPFSHHHGQLPPSTQPTHHSRYDEVYRLTDSIATDTAFDEEGKQIFSSLQFANDDWHPDAHACRLKISLVTVDSGMDLPWDLTIDAARHCVKLNHVAATCRLAQQEELQLLETDAVVYEMDESICPAYDPRIHDPYSVTLVKNRCGAPALPEAA